MIIQNRTCFCSEFSVDIAPATFQYSVFHLIGDMVLSLSRLATSRLSLLPSALHCGSSAQCSFSFGLLGLQHFSTSFSSLLLLAVLWYTLLRHHDRHAPQRYWERAGSMASLMVGIMRTGERYWLITVGLAMNSGATLTRFRLCLGKYMYYSVKKGGGWDEARGRYIGIKLQNISVLSNTLLLACMEPRYRIANYNSLTT